MFLQPQFWLTDLEVRRQPCAKCTTGVATFLTTATTMKYTDMARRVSSKRAVFAVRLLAKMIPRSAREFRILQPAENVENLHFYSQLG